jgi:uncharacterized DUF497 family protein
MDGFEWDEDKRQRNLAERGVDFRLAADIFQDVVLEAKDQRGDYGEIKYRAIGRVSDEFFVVTYTWRGRNRRIISAWRVGERGRRRYQALLSGRA